MDWISLLLAGSLPLIIVTGLISRMVTQKGVGWQFIRLMVCTMSLPLVGLLAFNSLLTSEIITFIALVVGYAFGRGEE